VLGNQRRPGLRPSLPDRGRDTGFAGGIPDGGKDGSNRLRNDEQDLRVANRGLSRGGKQGD
jgi:hypothetical protein